MILVFPSGSVSFKMDATVFDLEILWNVLSTSISSISYWSISMLWVLRVCDPLLDCDLDLEHLPLLGQWCISLCSCHKQVFYLSSWSWPWPLLRVILQQELKWYLKLHLWHFLPNAGQSLYECVVLHLLHILLLLVTQTTHSMWAAGSGAFLTQVWKFWSHLFSVSCVIPPFDLWWFKSFTIILCSLAYWSRAWYLTSSHLFFDLIHFFTLKCLVTWNRSSVLHTSFSSVMYWHLSTRFLICWSSWSVDSLSPCFISLYISSMWFKY